MSKLLIITRNKIDTSFWSTFLNSKKVNIEKFDISKNLISNIENYAPDLILLDDYFHNSENKVWMKSIIRKIKSNNPEEAIIWLSPEYCETNNSKMNIPNSCYSFSERFINDLKRILH
ncbi:MAG: hypothetical protein MK105_07620 [Crocinitomicaceae bacterium]|nr:hypothetical protein [Crocinitomicaceae bacterium]